MNRLKGLYRRWRRHSHDRQLEAVIIRSGLFDSNYYLRTYADVAQAGLDPFRHYVYHGHHESRAPSERFDPLFYLAAYPDVMRSGLDPVVHYMRHGWAEGRLAIPPEAIPLQPEVTLQPEVMLQPEVPPQPDQTPQTAPDLILNSGLFDPEYYSAIYLDVPLAGQEPGAHYLQFGRWEGRRPSLNFDPALYLASHPDLKEQLQEQEVDPLSHYLANRRTERHACYYSGFGRNELDATLAQIRSSGLFEEAFYLRQCPAVREAGVNPLLHYIVGNLAAFVDPGPSFSALEYAFSHPEIRMSGANPLLHFLNAGIDPVAAACAHLPPQPDDAITIERKCGVAYFERFLFTTDPADVPNRYVRDAVTDLVCRSQQLKMERIEPDVSIIVPVFGQIHFVLGCLDSLSRQRSRFSVEIIIADDVSPEVTEIWRLQAIPWLRYKVRPQNGGFLDTCNEAARLARGKFIVFLNSDTRVAEGWLDELIGSFALFPKAGLVGSSLFNADGTLQEAGGIYWRDGSAWNYGRNQNPNHPKYCFARKVDYVSGASMAVPADVWRKLDGFDVAYRPAYCEDADLAFRLRDAGYEVWLQPLSQVVHYEGKSNGRSLYSGTKKYQQINMRRLAARWQPVLAGHLPNGVNPDQQANRSVINRILVVDAVTPAPDQDSGSFVTVRMLKAFQVLGYDVTFVPQHNYTYDSTYTKALQRQGIECLYAPFFRTINDVFDFRSNFDLVLVYRVTVLDQIYTEIRRRLSAARLLFHNVDLHFLREEREAELLASRSKRVTAAITRATELELIAKVDCTIVHTKVETAIIRKYLAVENIIEFPYIAELHRTNVEFDERHDLMFLGGFNHPPNADAVKHFISCIWPALAQRLPGHARLLIVGSSPPAEIRRLAAPRIVITGHVQDLQSCFERARVFVAPIRYGAGIKGKVIQSLCHGTPSVITSVAAEGIGLVSGRDTVIADDDSSAVEQILNVYSNRALWYSLQAAGYSFAEENFSWKRGLDLTNKVLDKADEVWLARHERALRTRLRKIVAARHAPFEPDSPRAADAWNEPGQFSSSLVNLGDPLTGAMSDRFEDLKLPAVAD